MRRRLTLPILALVTAALAALAPAPAGIPWKSATFVDDGAWCWFADPRAFSVRGGGDEDRTPTTYAGWVTSTGDVAVGALDHATGMVRTAVLHAGFEVDDHANPALLMRPDGRLAVLYSKHADDRMRMRVTERPGDVGAWSDEAHLRLNPEGPQAAYCYPNPVVLPDENDRVLLFWRGTNWKPCVSTSDDHGATWSPGRIAFSAPGAGPGVRPYLKVAGDGAGRIHFAMTDGHPRNEATNSIRYCYYEDGGFFRADGTRIGSMDDLPVDMTAMDVVYDGGAGGGRAWIWDIAAAGAGGEAVIVFSRLPAEGDHHYHYACRRGGRWRQHAITSGGGWFPRTPEGKREPEPHYSGGVVLDHDDPRTVYLSRPIDGVFEIQRWRTSDGGETWMAMSVTSGSRHHNVRPAAVRGRGPEADPAAPRVLWMRLDGGYEHYTRYETSIRMGMR